MVCYPGPTRYDFSSEIKPGSGDRWSRETAREAFILRPCSDLVPVPGHGAWALKWTLFTHASARNQRVHKQLVKELDYVKIGNKFGVGASTELARK